MGEKERIQELIFSYADLWREWQRVVEVFLPALNQDGKISDLETAALLQWYANNQDTIWIQPEDKPEDLNVIEEALKSIFSPLVSVVIWMNKMLVSFIIESIDKAVQGWYMAIRGITSSELEKDYETKIVKIFDSVENAPRGIKELYDMSSGDMKVRHHIKLTLMLFLYDIGEAFSSFKMLFSKAEKEAYEGSGVTEPDAMLILNALFRDLDGEDREMLIGMLRNHGFDQGRIDLILKGAKPILGPQELQELYRRKEIETQEEFKDRIQMLGYNDNEAEEFRKLSRYRPSYQDIIRLMVREAYYPDYIKSYQADLEYNEEFFEADMDKSGLDPYWAKRLWWAHWELPSLTQGYEMLHRRKITTEDLNNLFKAHDIMPWWRDKLEAISYRPFSRVDVRRMYRVGTLQTSDEVYDSYRDLGYDNEKAWLMTDFTVRYETDREKSLTKADYLNLYKRNPGQIDLVTAGLRYLGYSDNSINILISKIDYDRQEAIEDEQEKVAKQSYIDGSMSMSVAHNLLVSLGDTSVEADYKIQQWEIIRKAKIVKISKEIAFDLYKRAYWSDKKFDPWLTDNNYDPAIWDDVKYWIKNIME